MTVPRNSRYVNGALTRLPNAVGVYNLSVLRTVPAQVTRYKLYTWRPGDRPDIVAFRLLGNSLLWWSIFDINPNIIDPMAVQPGAVLKVPTSPVTEHGTLLQ